MCRSDLKHFFKGLKLIESEIWTYRCLRHVCTTNVREGPRTIKDRHTMSDGKCLTEIGRLWPPSPPPPLTERNFPDAKRMCLVNHRQICTDQLTHLTSDYRRWLVESMPIHIHSDSEWAATTYHSSQDELIFYIVLYRIVWIQESAAECAATPMRVLVPRQ